MRSAGSPACGSPIQGVRSIRGKENRRPELTAIGGIPDPGDADTHPDRHPRRHRNQARDQRSCRTRPGLRAAQAARPPRPQHSRERGPGRSSSGPHARSESHPWAPVSAPPTPKSLSGHPSGPPSATVGCWRTSASAPATGTSGTPRRARPPSAGRSAPRPPSPPSEPRRSGLDRVSKVHDGPNHRGLVPHRCPARPACRAVTWPVRCSHCTASVMVVASGRAVTPRSCSAREVSHRARRDAI